MKCNKCGYDWSNSGDSAHVCGPVKVKQQEQGEPVAWIDNSGHPKHMSHVQSVSERKLYGARRPLYEAPQQRTWVGLTDEEWDEMWIICGRPYLADWYNAAEAIEAKLKEKNT